MNYEVDLKETEEFLSFCLKREIWYMKSRMISIVAVLAGIIALLIFNDFTLCPQNTAQFIGTVLFFALVVLEIVFTLQVNKHMSKSARLVAVLVKAHGYCEAYDSIHTLAIINNLDKEFVESVTLKLYNSWVKDFKDGYSKKKA